MTALDEKAGVENDTAGEVMQNEFNAAPAVFVNTVLIQEHSNFDGIKIGFGENKQFRFAILYSRKDIKVLIKALAECLS